jgi:phosphonate transport system substrate-binding protein
MSVIPYAKDGKLAIQNIKPLYDAITDESDIHFKLSYGKSYSAVMEAFCNQQIQLALFDTFTYGEVRKKCLKLAEILAAEIKGGSSNFYSGIFVRKGNNLNTLKDLTGKSIALGAKYSTSSFNFPVSMLIKDGIDPINDFEHIFVTGSHSASINALKTGKAMAAGASFGAWISAVSKENIDPLYFKPLAKSSPIPNDPIVMNKNLPKALKKNLRKTFSIIHAKLSSDELVDLRGAKIDRYDVDVGEQVYINSLKELEVVTEKVKKSILEKANQH